MSDPRSDNKAVVIVIDWKRKKVMVDFFNSQTLAEEFAQEIYDDNPYRSVAVEVMPPVQG